MQFYGFPNEASVYYQNAAFLSDLELALEDRLNSLIYLGPVRSVPERLYTWAGGIPEDVGWTGGRTIEAILSSSDRYYNWQPRQRRRSFETVVAEWLKEMKLIQSFEVAAIAPDRDEYEVQVSVSGRDRVKLTDVGFGVSQVLPVLVQCFYAAPNSTVLMEQPEIHLHPSVQASLADMFLSANSAREDGEARNVQFVIESHSEHLLRRLQLRIAEGEIAESDVALYFCFQENGESRLERLEVDVFGDVRNWPRDFFGDELGDVAAQARLALQGRLRARP